MSYECKWDDCKFISDNFEVFYSHVGTHTKFLDENNEDDIICKWRKCSSEFIDSQTELITHVLFHAYHAKLKDLGLKAQLQAKLAPCALNSQARNLVPEFPEPFTCYWDNCNMITTCPKTFYRHVDGHVNSTVKENANTVVSCLWRDCSFSSTKRFKLKEHCRTHTQEKTFSCPNCGGLFANKTKLTDHLRRQNTMESESYQCSHCLKYCASERILRDHMAHHVNNVKCPFCEMTCTSPSALQNHIKFRHSKKKPYACNMCDASFKMPNDLRRHQEIHNPLFSYTCKFEGCNYAAKVYQSLKRHYKVQHEISSLADDGGKYACHICQSRYSRGANLTNHLKKVHKFRWPAGHKRFRYKEDLDGFFRLQTVRYESVELSQQLEDSRKQQEMIDESEEDWDAPEVSNQEALEDAAMEFANAQAYSNENQTYRRQISTSHETVRYSEQMQSNIPTSQQSFQGVLNSLQTQCVPANSSLDPMMSSDIQISSTQSVDTRLSLFAKHDSIDLEEAVSLLSTLRNSGTSFEQQ